MARKPKNANINIRQTARVFDEKAGGNQVYSSHTIGCFYPYFKHTQTVWLKYGYTIALLFLCCCCAVAQTRQSGIVKEYNEQLAKTALGQVEIVVTNAGSTVSDSKGRFQLEFRTLKPGDKVNVRRIEKLGYVIFNKEAIDQWVISKDKKPFTIVMCQEERFKRIRDNYNAVSSASYKKQREKDELHLENERRAGLLKEEEYERAMKALKDEYDRQLENLDNYIDRFVRIDLNELSDQEAAIIQLVQNGEIDAAIEIYEKLSFINTYKRECENIEELNEAKLTLRKLREQKVLSRDSIFSSILRQVNTYALAGGVANFEKARKLLYECAIADTTYLDAVWEYAYFMDNQNEDDEAIRFYNTYANQCTDRLSLTSLYNNLGAIYERNQEYTKAEYYFKTNLVYSQERYSRDKRTYWDLVIMDFHNLGTLYDDWGKSDSAVVYYEKAFAVYSELSDSLDDEELADKSMLYNNYGAFCFKQGDFEKAALNYGIALDIRKTLYDKDSSRYKAVLAMTLHNIGALHQVQKEYDVAWKYYLESFRMRKQLVDSNPRAYKSDLQSSLTNIVPLGFEMQLLGDSVSQDENRYDEAEQLCKLAYSIREVLYELSPDEYIKDFSTSVNNLAGLYVEMEKYDEAISLYRKAETLYARLCESDDDYLVDLMNVFYWIGILSDEVQGNTQQAIVSWSKGLGVCKKLYEKCPDAYLIQLVTICNNLCYAYAANQDYQRALETIDIAIEACDDEANLYDTKGEILMMSGNTEEAFRMWKKVIQLEPDFVWEHGESELYKQLKSRKMVK